MKTRNNDEIPKGYTRVTEILSVYKNFDQVPAHILYQACERGTKVHDLCELYALHMLIEKPCEEVKGYFYSFKNWFDTYVTDIVMVEERLFDRDLFLTGKFDLLCKTKGSDKLVLVDYKTCALSDRSWCLQMAAYSALLYKMHDIEVDRRITLRLRKDGSSPILDEYFNHQNDKKLFFNQLEIYRYFNPIIT